MSALAIISSQAFSPNKFSGLKLWMDAADKGTILDSADAVDQWISKSSITNKATQTGSKRPTTNTRTRNGLNVIDFDGVDDLMVLDNQPILAREARTIIVVGLGDVPVNNILLALSHSPPISGELYTVTTEIGLIIFNADRKFANDVIDDGINPAIVIFTNQAISDLTYDVSNFQAYKNGALITSTSVLNPTTTIDTRVSDASIGDEGTVGGPNRLNGFIGEIFIYDRVVSLSERQQIDSYLFNKWDIALQEFSPLDLNPELWLDATDASTITITGSGVSIWADKSFHSNDFTQATDAKRPLFDDANDKITFDATTQSLRITTLPGTTDPVMVFFVAENVGQGGGGAGYFFEANSGSDQSFRSVSPNARMGAGLNLEYAKSDPYVQWVSSMLFDGASSEVWDNGVSSVTGDVGAGSWSTSGLMLGNNSGENRGLDGSIYEFIVINRELTTAEHNQLGNYLADKHGTTWTDIT